MDHMIVDTQVLQSKIGRMKQLQEELRIQMNHSQSMIQDLGMHWEGIAYNALFEQFTAFSERYYKQYDCILQEYIGFLENVVHKGYEVVEQENRSIINFNKG